MEDKKYNQVNSPEQLNQYIRLANPGVWVLLLAIVLLLIGVCIWGFYGKIDTKIKTVVVSDNYTSYAYVKEEDIEKIKIGMKVQLNNSENISEIIDIEESPAKVTDDMDEYARHLGNFQIGEWVYKCRLNKRKKQGIYSANIIIESIAPMTFIIN